VGVVSAIVICVAGTAEASYGWGYGLKFQDQQTVAGTRKGFIDFGDDGWKDLNQSFTVGMWMKREVSSSTARFPISINNFADRNYFQPFNGRYSNIDSSKLVYELNMSVFDETKWNYAAIVIGEGTSKVYMNGVLHASGEVSSSYSLRGSPAVDSGQGSALYLGAHLYDRITSQPRALSTNSFFGMLDELTIWSRMLTEEDILQQMRGPIDVSATIDSSIVVHYNFDVSCPDSVTENESLGLEHGDCQLSGNKIAKNWGASGSDYDLLLGQTDDTYGFGKTWLELRDTSECPKKLPFATPAIAPSEIEFPATSDVALVNVPQVVRVHSDSVVNIGFPQGHDQGSVKYILKEKPLLGKLTVDNVELVVDDSAGILGNTTLRYLAPSGFSTPIRVKLERSDNLAKHEIHIWPFKQPRLGQNIVDSKVVFSSLEDSTIFQVLIPGNAYDPSGDELQAVIKQLPSKGTLFNADYHWGSGMVKGDAITKIDDVLTATAGIFAYTPLPEGYGVPYDTFQVAFYGKTSGSSSVTLTVEVNILAVNDKPRASSGVNHIKEDSKEGVEIELNVSDPETAFGVFITKLPSKGKLYSVINGSRGQYIDRPYNLFDVGEPYDQFASKVLGVSSFWGKAPYSGYHALNVLGPQTCNMAGECGLDFRFVEPFETIPNGHLVRANVNPGNMENIVYTWAKVTRKVSGEGGNARYDVETVPMVNGERQPCAMTGSSYPSDCDTEMVNQAGVRVLKNISIQDMTSTSPGVWCPASLGYNGDDQVNISRVGNIVYYAFGALFEYNWGQQGYQTGDPKYTEFIEVAYDNPVFPVGIQIGSPRGTGAVVSIRAKSPQGIWEPIYRGKALHDAYEETNGRRMYHDWAPAICRPAFKASEFRLELDTSAQTGISDWNYIDYIKLLGSDDAQPGMLRFPIHKVIYIPDENAHGVDEFSFQANDCGGDRLRNSKPENIVIHVAAEPDAPTGEETIHLNKRTNRAQIDIRAHDVDGEDISVKLLTSPNHGQLYRDPEFRTPISLSSPIISQGTMGITASIWFKPPSCETPTQRIQVMFEYVVTDSADYTTLRKIGFNISCGDLPRTYVLATASTGAKAITYILGITGILGAIACALFNFKYRRLGVVKVTSPKINYVICLGCAFVYTYILSTVSSLPETCSDVEQLEIHHLGNSFTCVADNTCCKDAASSRCYTPITLLSIGIVLACGSLFAKTVRILSIFQDAMEMKKSKKIQDSALLVQVSIFLLVLICILVIWAITSPMQVEFIKGQDVVTADATMTALLYPTCTSDHQTTFSIVIIAFLGSKMLYGAHLAFSARNVHVTQLNDSKQIGLSVYNILVFGTINLGISELVPDPTSAQIIIALLTWLTTSLTLAVLYIPRVMDVKSNAVVDIISSQTRSVSTSRFIPQPRVVETDIEPPTSYLPSSDATRL